MKSFKSLLALSAYGYMIWLAWPIRWDDKGAVVPFLITLLPILLLGAFAVMGRLGLQDVDLTDSDLKGESSLLVLSASNWAVKIAVSVVPFGLAWFCWLDYIPRATNIALLSLGFLMLGIHYREVIDVRQRVCWREFGLFLPFYRSRQLILEPQPLSWKHYRMNGRYGESEGYKLKVPGVWTALVNNEGYIGPQRRDAIAREYEEKYPDLFYYEPDETLP